MFSFSWWLLSFRRRAGKIAATSRMIWRNKITQYPDTVTNFEKRFAKLCGTKHAITVNNGTSGLEAAYFALGIGPGDEIVTPSYTIHATFSAALIQGIGVKFADIEPHTLTVDPNCVEALITKKTKAIVVVHVWGNAVDMNAITRLAEKYNLKIIEDCSHCHGAKYAGKPLGSIGDIGVFSLQGGKPVAAGEGGVVVTNDDMLADRMLAYGHQGRRISGTMPNAQSGDFLPLTGFGRKCRAHPLAIAMANVDLGLLKKHNQLHKTGRAELEKTLNGSSIFKLQTKQDNAQMGGYFMGAAVRVISPTVSADTVIAVLKSNRVKVDRRNHKPYHQLPHLYDMDYREKHLHQKKANQPPCPKLPHTENALSQILFLPLKQFSGLKGQLRWKRAMAQLEREANAGRATSVIHNGEHNE